MTTAEALTVVSFNVGNGLAPPDQLSEFLRDTNADVIGLQELSVPQAEIIDKTLKEEYPARLLIPTGFSGKGLLSKFPLENGTSLDFAPGRPDLDAIIDVGERSLHVFVAHPRPPRVAWSGVLFDEVTDRQIQQVAAAAVNGRPSVVLGDFNMTERLHHHRLLSGMGLIDAFQEVDVRVASFPRRVGHSHRVGKRAERWPLLPMIRIDYVWYTDDLFASEAWVGPDAGSDHLPVGARLHWREFSDGT